MADLTKGPIADFRQQLGARGVRMLIQWECRREQCTVLGVAFRGNPQGPGSAVIELWPHGEFDSFYPSNSNRIADDVARVCDGYTPGQGER